MGMRYLLICSVFFFSSCQDEMMELAVGLHKPFIHPELRPHVDMFVYEAAQRGVHINTKKLRITFFDIKEQGKAYDLTNTILIRRDVAWNEVPEELVFHEMGHLFLKRGHDNSMIGYNNRVPKSIMNNETNGYYEYKNEVRGADFSYRRKYYIDELFDPKTQVPGWAFNAELVNEKIYSN